MLLQNKKHSMQLDNEVVPMNARMFSKGPTQHGATHALFVLCYVVRLCTATYHCTRALRSSLELFHVGIHGRVKVRFTRNELVPLRGTSVAHYQLVSVHHHLQIKSI